MIEQYARRAGLHAAVCDAAAWADARARALTYAAQEANAYRVVEAFMAQGLSESDLAGTTGYGYDDPARDAYESLLCRLFGTERALARLSLVSGTHAIVATLAACVPPGRTLLSATGAPYDTLQNAIVTAPHALVRQGIGYVEVPLAADGFDEVAVLDALRGDPSIGAMFVQRSRGYAPRASMTVAQCERLFTMTKTVRPDVTIVVDDCYGELVETREPTHVGADVAVGSLIKNLGGSIAPAGAYLAGTMEIVERVAERHFAPGLGASLGPTLGFGRAFLQGLFHAPQVVAECLRGLDFAAALFERLGFDASPACGDPRTDIVQAIRLGTERRLLAFAGGLQASMPVNARFRPTPGNVPGYAEPVVMSSGAFVAGATIELSCDAPLRAPFEVYLQGGVSRVHAMIGAVHAAHAVLAAG
ncbi:MAG: methionine gamma-lyase family protein [Candidatus Eremiobacteraeota bacterium]|nr:methionine gamma-lyase family protein [Candidatus Eremiobacteraeota bacterium]